MVDGKELKYSIAMAHSLLFATTDTAAVLVDLLQFWSSCFASPVCSLNVTESPDINQVACQRDPCADTLVPLSWVLQQLFAAVS